MSRLRDLWRLIRSRDEAPELAESRATRAEMAVRDRESDRILDNLRRLWADSGDRSDDLVMESDHFPDPLRARRGR